MEKISIFEFCDMCQKRIPHNRQVYRLLIEPVRYGEEDEGLIYCEKYICSDCLKSLEVENL